MGKQTRVDAIFKRIMNHKIFAACAVFGIVVISLGTFTDAVGRILDFVAKARKLREPALAELIDNASRCVIKAKIDRLDRSGEVVITPVGLFRDPGPLADQGYTYLLCRITNTSSRQIIIGALEDETGRWYRLDDPKLGYMPVAATLVQRQGWFRGRPINPSDLAPNTYRRSGGTLDAATLDAGKTAYGYINSLGDPWRGEMTFSVIDVTDTAVGSVRVRIQVEDTAAMKRLKAR